jgi:hypothetical protein
MSRYLLAGQKIWTNCPVPELEPYQTNNIEPEEISFALPAAHTLINRTLGWVGGEQRLVECWSAPPGWLLKVAGGCDVYIGAEGRSIVRLEAVDPSLDMEILAGPALVLALALRGVWCLHASAGLFEQQLTVFLGESGQGKSTLARSLSALERSKWSLVADDILPVRMDTKGLLALPRFPQLKLPVQAQPGTGLPELLHVDRVCVLAKAGKDETPALQSLPPKEAVQALLRHTAGTRMFDPDLLASHLVFCTQAAKQAPVFQLIYPHRKDAIPQVKEMMEGTC